MKNTVKIDRATYFIYAAMRSRNGNQDMLRLANMVEMKHSLYRHMGLDEKWDNAIRDLEAFIALISPNVYSDIRDVYEFNKVTIDSEVDISWDDNTCTVYGVEAEILNLNEADMEHETMELENEDNLHEEVSEAVREINYEIDNSESHICWEDMNDLIVRPNEDNVIDYLVQIDTEFNSGEVESFISKFVQDYEAPLTKDNLTLLLVQLAHQRQLAIAKSEVPNDTEK